jgi:hypothetical protein
MVAQHAARTGLPVAAAAREVLDGARANALDGVGPALTVGE